MTRKFWFGLGALAVLAAVGAQGCGNGSSSPNNATAPSGITSNALDAKPGGLSAVQLNLSHIECVIGGVEIHFVLLHVPTGASVGNLTWSNNGVVQAATIPSQKQSGNVYHFTAIVPSGSYNVTAATVQVGGATIRLHNPGEYAGTYNCNQPYACAGFQLPSQYTAARVCLPVLGSPNSECGLLGLAPDGKDDPVAAEPHPASKNAAVAIVKDGSVGCGGGQQAYRFYSPVTAGQLLSRPEGSGAISHVTYCACPAD